MPSSLLFLPFPLLCGVSSTPVESAPPHRSCRSRAGKVWVASRAYGGTTAGDVTLAPHAQIIHALIVLCYTGGRYYPGSAPTCSRSCGRLVSLIFSYSEGETLDANVPSHVVGDGLTRIFYFFAINLFLLEVLLGILTRPHLDVYQLILIQHYCALHIWFDFDFDLLRELALTGSSFQARFLFPRAPLSPLSTFMILHKQSDCPRSEEEEGGMQVVASSLPFQNSCLAGRGGCRARGCYSIGCRNGFDVRG